MRLSEWAMSLLAKKPVEPVLGWFSKAESKPFLLDEISSELRPVLISACYRKLLEDGNSPKFLLIVSSYEKALQWQAKLGICGVPTSHISVLPSGISSLFEDSIPEHIALSERLGALKALVQNEPHIVIATPQSALERTIPQEILVNSFIELRRDGTYDLAELESQLSSLGYEIQDPVRLPGSYSRRGGILDIFPSGAEHPYRIEFFDDLIESVRRFDANTQKSIEAVAVIEIAPSRETVYPETVEDLRSWLEFSVDKEAAELDEAAGDRLRELIQADLIGLESKAFFDRIDLYRPYLQPESGAAISLLNENGFIILDEPWELNSVAVRAEEEVQMALSARFNRGEMLRASTFDFLLPADELARQPRTLVLSTLNGGTFDFEFGEESVIGSNVIESYRGRPEAFALLLRNALAEGYEIILGTDQPKRAHEVLTQAEISPGDTPEPGILAILSGNLGGGFLWPKEKLAMITDAELFGVARLKLPQKRFMEGAPISTALDLKPGDFVVHISFGIGVFRGLVKKMSEGFEKEFLLIEYANPDKLFVPADQLDRVQKYLNPGDEVPKLNRLTGGEWKRTLGKARDGAREFARDLVKLYAKRKAVSRKPFAGDSPWQAEMESTFPYVETPSQLNAITEAKRDLEQPFPMDRLVCGDVGFGKTEVAIRAAFKVVQDLRQVAVLCPTTILSEQHFRSFSERLESFGVRISVINRFTHTAARRTILEDLKAGKVDILIGTHSLLGKGVQFSDLGLVVIDEEQKFGVKQKEMLKEIRTQVDVLTLSATPIPRTLSMALMDIRQMSLINDPPPGRLPVRTILRPYSSEVVREAILRELARGGQVFYVYNRVDSIRHVEEQLKRLVPGARIGVGHGQMSEAELEPIMIGFIQGEIDILLSTTIIENGIDISNANTLIVDNADRLGLSQLYQLRGRVGRSDRQAYAYFLYDRENALTENARARLKSLQEFSNLGSGYSLAFRDLQIRGAGDLLGSKQHGEMASVGFELYSQLINEQVGILKTSVDGEGDISAIADPLESLAPLPSFDLPLKALIPDDYIRDQAQRLYYYQRMMSSRTSEQLNAAESEIIDRYGQAPDEVVNAFLVMGLRIRARDLGMDHVEFSQGRVAVNFQDIQAISPRALLIVTKMNRGAFVTQSKLIWPAQQSPISAIERVITELELAQAQVASELGQFAVRN